MLRLGVVFLIIALIAAFLGFGGIANMSYDAAKIFFFIFLVLAILSLALGWRGGRPVDTI